jgi:hypothetical protein
MTPGQETAVEHVRNALQILNPFKDARLADLAVELTRADVVAVIRRLNLALAALEGDHHASH